MHGVEHRGDALHREYCPPDRLQEPADGARCEAHKHCHVMCEQEEAACQLLAILDHQVHPAVASSHSAVVHDETRRTGKVRILQMACEQPSFTERRSIKMGLHHAVSRRSGERKVLCLLMLGGKTPLWFLCGCDVSQMTTSCETKQLVTLHEGKFRLL